MPTVTVAIPDDLSTQLDPYRDTVFPARCITKSSAMACVLERVMP